jgi:integrase/recombinase XerD
MRISELIGLPLFQLADDAAPSLLIRGKGGRKGFFHPPQARAALDRYRPIRPLFLSSEEGPNPHLFPSRGKNGHLMRQRVGQLLKELSISCGMSNNPVSPNGLRHAFATHLLQKGVDLLTLKDLLGHKDISTTQIYTHVQTEHWASLLSRHHPLEGGFFPGTLS